jgi:hypothetical protein
MDQPRKHPHQRAGSYLPSETAPERWGLLTPAAIALALLLMIGIIVYRMTAG